jgi:hypothetical protein
MLAKSRFWVVALGITVGMALFAAGPAAAKEKEKPQGAVATSGSGVGIAPGAPDWVREQVRQVHAAKDDTVLDAEKAATRGLQARWFGCRDVWAYRGYDHTFGYNLFRYYQQVSWCSNGYSIYSWSRFRWAEVNGPGWSFDGHVDSALYGSTTHKTAFTQGQFHACVFGFCDYKTPWVLIDVNVNGGWSANTGG